MKGSRPHAVPLPPRAMELLKGLPRENENPFVFIGRRGRMGPNTLLYLLKSLRTAVTVHGFRSTFGD